MKELNEESFLVLVPARRNETSVTVTRENVKVP